MSLTTVPPALPEGPSANLRVFGARPFHTDGDLIALGFSEDGTLWSMEDPGILRRWNVSAKQQTGWQQLDELATQWAFSPGACFVAAGSDDLSVWEVATGDLIEMWQHPSWITAIAFAPGKTLLATGHDDNVVRLWDRDFDDYLLELRGHDMPVSAVAFSCDGKHLASAGEDRVIRIWDVTNGRLEGSLIGHTDRVPALAWHPDGKRLISAGWDTTARVWDLQTFSPIILLNSHATQVQAIAVSPDGGLLACADSANAIHIWEMQQYKPATVLTDRGAEIRCLTFSLDGQRLASGGADRVIQLWDSHEGSDDVEHVDPQVSRTCIAVINDGKRLASLGAGTNLRVWDVASREPVLSLAGADKLRSFAATPDGKYFAASRAVNDGSEFWQRFGGRRIPTDLTTLGLWDAATGERRAVLEGQTGPITALAFASDSKTLASGSFQSSDVWLWHVPAGQALLLIANALEGCSVEALAFQPNGSLMAVAGIDWLATGGGDGHVALWDFAQRRKVRTIKGGGLSLAFHPSGQQLAVASPRQSVHIWDVDDAAPPIELVGHFDVVTSVAYSPDGRLLATGSEDRSVRLWDAATGADRGVVELDTQVKAIAFAPDGVSVFTGNGNTSCYQIAVQQFIAHQP
jgi:WD40 repeat protein